MNICRPIIRKCDLEEKIDFAEEWAVICLIHGIHTHHSTWSQAMWVAELHIKRVNKRRKGMFIPCNDCVANSTGFDARGNVTRKVFWWCGNETRHEGQEFQIYVRENQEDSPKIVIVKYTV